MPCDIFSDVKYLLNRYYNAEMQFLKKISEKCFQYSFLTYILYVTHNLLLVYHFKLQVVEIPLSRMSTGSENFEKPTFT